MARPVSSFGKVASYDHIMWQCRHTEHLRAHARSALPVPYGRLPVCFRRATLVPVGCSSTTDSLHAIQAACVDVWQHHIQAWNEAADDVTVQIPVPPGPVSAKAESGAIITQEPEKKGHTLCATPQGGMFCVKCGKQTKISTKWYGTVPQDKRLPRKIVSELFFA